MMRYLILPLIALAFTSCNQYSNNNGPCCPGDECCEESCQTYCADEQDEDKLAAELEELNDLEEATAYEISGPEALEAKEKIANLAANFTSIVKEKLGATTHLTTAATPINGVSSLMSTDDKLDIKSARKMILESAEALLELANNDKWIKKKAPKFPLTVEDLDIFIDSTDKDAMIHSVSLIRGIIEYESFDPETNTYKVVKQEPFSHGVAKSNTTNCCGAYFVCQE